MTQQKRVRPVAILLLLIGALALSGCATVKPMPLQTQADKVELEDESLILVSVAIENELEPAFQPKITTMFMAPEGFSSASQILSLTPPEPVMTTQAGVKHYLLSANLKPGIYELISIRCQAARFPVIASCILPINRRVSVYRPGEVTYLGHIDAVIREKQDGHVAAGPTLPLLDQHAAGMSRGSFDVKFEDRLDADMERFRIAYPALEGIPVRRKILRTWVRPTEAPSGDPQTTLDKVKIKEQ